MGIGSDDSEALNHTPFTWRAHVDLRTDGVCTTSEHFLDAADADLLPSIRATMTCGHREVGHKADGRGISGAHKMADEALLSHDGVGSSLAQCSNKGVDVLQSRNRPIRCTMVDGDPDTSTAWQQGVQTGSASAHVGLSSPLAVNLCSP
tara:strand:- start:902 stop:1348 length:447 start_codon:yes stop_codon:yes gene_type:complete